MNKMLGELRMDQDGNPKGLLDKYFFEIIIFSRHGRF